MSIDVDKEFEYLNEIKVKELDVILRYGVKLRINKRPRKRKVDRHK